MQNRLGWVKLLLATLLVSVGLPHAQADSVWPSKTVTLVVPYAAGGTADMIARRLADGLRTSGNPVIIENKTGAGGSIGAEFVARANPDGTTLLLASTSALTIFPNLAKTSYNPETSFIPIASVAVGPVAIAATKALNVKDFAGLIAYAKANPGKVSFGVPGLGTVAHLLMSDLSEQAGVKMRQIPYRGNSQALTDGLAGVIDLVVSNTDVLLPHVTSGAIKPLAITAPARLAAWPDVPTMAEVGYPGIKYFSTYGLFAPAGTDSAIVQRIQEQVEKVLASAQYQDYIRNSSLQPGTGLGGTFKEQLRQELDNNRRVIRDQKIQLE